MKQSKYINKYDFINYYTKQKEMWFFKNDEIQAGIDLALKKLNINENFIDNNESDFGDDIKFDSYQYYSQIKLENENIDLENPLILEGNIIDEKSKYLIIDNFNIKTRFDLDDKKYKKFSMEEKAIETKKIIEENEYVIIFQPVFISKNLITKCDSLVKEKNIIKIIETKGTTSIKVIHLLDLLFQKKVIDRQDFLNDYQKKFRLCIVEYKRMKKNELGLITTKYCNISKNSPNLNKTAKSEFSKNEIIKIKQLLKMGIIFKNNDFENEIKIRIDTILNNDWIDFQKRYDISKGNSINSLDKFKENLINVINNFDFVINELQEFKNKMNIKDYPNNFIPSEKDKSFFKTNEYFPYLREIFAKSGYDLFLFSGNIMDQSHDVIKKYNIQDDLRQYLKGQKNKDIYEKAYFGKDKIFIQNSANIFNEFNKLKPNRIYFDFETINTAIRVIDESLPFDQIVSQCSIIKLKENDKVENTNCQNLIIDPRLIDIKWFKKIIDEIYYDDNSSYIVYNKSFEESRIKEMAEMINENNYYIKAKKINDNLFDLADFFNPLKKMILIKELYGFYSIKKLLPIIKKYHSDLFEKTKSKDYNKLEIHNGLICQQKTILRFFNKINDSEWKELEEKLKEYCENDVRAMIAVELFIKHIIENKKLEK